MIVAPSSGTQDSLQLRYSPLKTTHTGLELFVAIQRRFSSIQVYSANPLYEYDDNKSGY